MVVIIIYDDVVKDVLIYVKYNIEINVFVVLGLEVESVICDSVWKIGEVEECIDV